MRIWCKFIYFVHLSWKAVWKIGKVLMQLRDFFAFFSCPGIWTIYCTFRKYMVGVGYFAACGLYLFCLYWMPTKDSSIGAAIGLLLLSGFVDACCRTLSSGNLNMKLRLYMTLMT